MSRLSLVVGLVLCASRADATDVWDAPFPGVRHLHRTGPSNLNIHASIVDLCAPGVSVRTTAYAERAQRTSAFASAVGAQLAINADFSCRPIDVGANSPFPPCVGHVAYVTYGLAMHDGQAWPGTLGLDALLAFGADRAQLYDNAEMQPFEAWMREGTGGHFSTVINGAANGYDCPIDPRTAVGLSKDQTKLIMVVADGRSTWRGITCREAADLLVELGADRGTGLDSGGSSTMWFAGQGVLNHPSDGTERVVGNHLAIYASGVGPPAHCVQPPTTINANAALPTVVPVGVVGRLNALTPLRLFDTRDAAGAAGLIALARDGTGRVAASSPFSLQLTGAFGVPGDATAVAMNLSAVDATAGGFARAWPALVTEPTASTVNFPAASVVTNSALVGVGSNGQLSFSANVPTHLVADLQGFFATAGAGFVPEKGKRLLDTRADAGGMLKAHVSRVIVPASAAAAVALNVSATGSANAGFVTVFPCDQPVPVASSVNFAAGQTLGASVIARMGPAGVCAVAMVDVHVIVDQVGVFEAVGGLAFQPVQPVRLVDTRAPTSPWVGRTTRQTPLELDVARLAGLPARSQALALNVTVTDAVDDGFVTVFPCASGLPGTSNVNYRAGQTVANLALVGVGDGKVCVTSTGRTHVILDLTGVFVAPPPPTPDGGSMPVDAGSPPTDAGEAPPPDAGADAPASPHGCGCRGGDVPLAAFALLLIALGRRSR